MADATTPGPPPALPPAPSAAHAELRALIAAYDPAVPLASASLPPADWYTDPRFFALDRDAVLRRHWHCAGPLALLQKPGDYLTGQLAGLPWLVVRDDSGALRGYWNVCRHHAALLLDGAGNVADRPGCAGQIRCPYHGWTWRLDGSFRHAPQLAGVRDFDRAAHGLLPLPVRAWGALAMVFLGDGPPPPLPSSTLLSRLDATGWRDLHHLHREVFEVEADWKVFVDNYLDGGYHIPVAHPGLDAELEPSAYRLEAGDTWSIQSSRGREPAHPGDSEGAPDRDRCAGEAVYAWLHPTLCVNRYGDWLDLNLIEPLGPGRTRVVFDWLHVRPALPPAELNAALAASRQIQDEDAWLCARVQQGKASPAYHRGRYVARMEALEQHFHRLLAEDYRRQGG